MHKPSKRVRIISSILCFILIFGFNSSFASAGKTDNWETIFSSSNLKDVAYNGNNLYVMVGSYGTIRTSKDGEAWVNQRSGTADSLNSIIWDGKQFVVVGDDGTILTSTDGIKWVEKKSNTKAVLEDIIYDGKKYIAVGGENRNAQFYGVTIISNDTDIWTIGTTEINGWLKCIASDGNKLISVVMDGKIISSIDGIRWECVYTGPKDTWLNSVSWNGKVFMAVGSDGVILTSSDGTRWEKQVSNTSNYLISCTWDGKQFIVIGDDDLILLSIDGVTWKSSDIYYRLFPNNIVHCGDKYLILCDYETALISTDFVNWTYNEPKSLYGSLCGIANNGKLLVATGPGGTIITSPDGTDWTKQNSQSRDCLNDIIWDGTRFICIGDSGTILFSNDGISWTAKKNDLIKRPEKILWNGYQYIIVGQDGLILSSPDCINWTKREWSYNYEFAWLMDVAWDGHKYIAVGEFGLMLSSTDGVNWREVTSPTKNSLNSITWNGSEFIIAGDGGCIMKSADGLKWDDIGISSINIIEDIVWDGKSYSVVTRSGDIFKSTDKIHWVLEQSVDNILGRIAWNGYRYIALGRELILTSIPTDIIKVIVNEKPVVFDVAPVSKDGQNLVPLRSIFNALGADVKWDNTTKTITGKKGDTTIILKLDSKDALVNGKHVALDVPASSINGKTFVPIRFISESLGADVKWDGSTQTIIITSK